MKLEESWGGFPCIWGEQCQDQPGTLTYTGHMHRTLKEGRKGGRLGNLA